MRAALGIAKTVDALAPAELINACLKAPVDLLWNGGIGTYVKAAAETNAEVGDKANDGLRVNGADVQGQVRRARAATSASPSSAGSSTRTAGAGSTPTSSTTPPASTPPTTR